MIGPAELAAIRRQWKPRNLLALPWDKLLRALGWRCVYCGRDDLKASLTKDHLHPKAKGGRDHRNIVPACQPCNTEKGSRTARQYATWLRAQGRRADFLLPGEWW